MIRVSLFSAQVRPTSGWGAYTYELCCEFQRRSDIDFELYIPPEADVDGEVPFADRIRRTLPPWAGSFRRRPQKVLPYLFPRMKLSETDIIHSLVEFPYGILAWKLARNAGLPFIITAHGTFGVVPLMHWFDRWKYRPALEQSAFTTVPSGFTAQAMLESGRVRPNFSIIHNAVNYARFQGPVDTTVVRKRYGIAEGARIVLGVGALKARKGFDVLVKAFQSVIQMEPQARLVIVGEGPQGPLRDLAASLGIADGVHLVGPVPGDDLVGLYHLCEVYAHLPRNYQWNFEGFGLVYLEAGACGKPVVATRSGGVADAVVDGETGLLVEEEDSRGAAAAILRLLQDPVLAQVLGQGGRQYAAQHTRSWYGDQMVGLYREALSGHQP